MAIAALGFSYNQIRVRSRFQVRKKIPQKIRARSNDQIKCWLTGLGREAGFRLRSFYANFMIDSSSSTAG